MRLVFLAILCAGCADAPKIDRAATDQCIRERVFKECMALIPTGPTHTVGSNDWDEVVKECASAAYWQSQRMPGVIKPECYAP